MTIIVTSGATREPIDAVRYISNVSTGQTGAALAGAFLCRGHAVLLLRGRGSAEAGEGIQSEEFSSAADLEERLRRRLGDGRIDAVIMAAAVADYRPAEALSGKTDSQAGRLSLVLVRNPKILPRIKSFGPNAPAVVGFKRTVGADETARRAAVLAQWSAGGVDLVVHNDLDEMRASPVHPFWIWSSPGTAPEEVEGPEALALRLDVILAGKRRQAP